MIISANRLSSVNGRVNIGINENYGSEDLGRILMEDAMNDMAIFNATLMQDMHEIKVRQEGTMLESEIEAISESAIKDFCKKIVDKLKAFWAKMKAWFKTAIANISAYVVRDGQSFVKMHLKDISRLKADTECGTRWKKKGDLSTINLSAISGDLTSDAYSEDDSVSDIQNKMYKKILSSYEDDKSFYDCAKEHFFEEVTNATISDLGGTSKLTDTLKSGKDQIKAMKKLKSDGEKNITTVIKRAERTASKARDAEDRKKEGERNQDTYDAKSKEAKILGNMASAATNVIGTVSRAGVKLVKFDLAQARKALATAIGRGSRAEAKAKYESTLLESLLLEADEEIEQITDNDYAEDLTPAEEEAVEALVDAIEEKIEDSDSGDDE